MPFPSVYLLGLCGGAALSGLQKAVEPSQRLPHTLRPPTYNFQNTNAPTLSSHPTMSHLQSILDAMDAYANETGVNLKDNPFANKVKDCGSPNDVLLLLQENMKAFKDYRDQDRKFLDCLGPVVKSVHGLSRFLAEATSNVSRNNSCAIYLFIPLSIQAHVPCNTNICRNQCSLLCCVSSLPLHSLTEFTLHRMIPGGRWSQRKL